MTTYAFDTNTISYLLRNEGSVQKNYEQIIIKDRNEYALPPIVIYELQRWLRDKITPETKVAVQNFKILLDAVKHKSVMTLEMWNKSADIYIALKRISNNNKVKKSMDADIMIASYCLINNYTLVTKNKKDFENIDGLKIVDWF